MEPSQPAMKSHSTTCSAPPARKRTLGASLVLQHSGAHPVFDVVTAHVPRSLRVSGSGGTELPRGLGGESLRKGAAQVVNAARFSRSVFAKSWRNERAPAK
jgi:hypothetical protein